MKQQIDLPNISQSHFSDPANTPHMKVSVTTACKTPLGFDPLLRICLAQYVQRQPSQHTRQAHTNCLVKCRVSPWRTFPGEQIWAIRVNFAHALPFSGPCHAIHLSNPPVCCSRLPVCGISLPVCCSSLPVCCSRLPVGISLPVCGSRLPVCGSRLPVGISLPVCGSRLPVCGSRLPVGISLPVCGSRLPVCGSRLPVCGILAPVCIARPWLAKRKEVPKFGNWLWLT